jgi:ABC-type branched-subunit amino acid transport system substrate-binding protein
VNLVKQVRWLVVACILALIASGCSRSDDDTGATTSGGTSASTAPEHGPVSFGSERDVCGPGDASGATAQGVTDDSIRVATFADPGFAGRPGLNQELFDTATVFSKWCNDAGGINGRSLVVDLRDAALTNYQALMVESCRDDFFLVGGGAVFDNTGVEDRLECLLPDIAGFVATPETRSADLLVQPNPSPFADQTVGEFRWLGKEYPRSTEHVGILTGDLAPIELVAKAQRQGVEKLGWKVVYDDEYPAAGVADWTPYVQALKDKGVRGLIWIGEPESLAKLEQAMTNANYEVDWVRAETNNYDRTLIEIAGAGLQPTFVPMNFAPFERASTNPATQQYLDLFARYAPDAKTKALLGLQAWSAWLLFAKAVKACGSGVTRKCVYDHAARVHSWTGGGLQSETDPGNDGGSRCFAMVKATPKGFVAVDIDANDGVYACSDRHRVPLPGPFPESATLADVGKSMDDLK